MRIIEWLTLALFSLPIPFICHSQSNPRPNSLEIIKSLDLPQDSTNLRIEISKFYNALKDLKPDSALRQELRLAVQLSIMGQYFTANAIFIEILPRLLNADDLVKAYKNLGRNYYSQGHYELALKEYMKGIELSDSLHIKSADYAWLLRYTGSVYKRLENNKEAKTYYVSALKIFTELSDTDGLASCLNNLAIIAGLENDKIAQRQYYQKGLTISRENNNRNKEGIILANLGHLEMTDNNFTKAKDYFESAKQIWEQTNDFSNLAQSYFDIGYWYFTQKKIQDALENYHLALDIAKLSLKKQKLRFVTIYEGLYHLYENKNADSCTKYIKLFYAYRDSLQSAETLEKIASISQQYEGEKKNREIAHLNTQKKLNSALISTQEQLIGRQKNWIVIFGLCLLILLAFISLLIKQKIELKNAYSILFAKNKPLVVTPSATSEPTNFSDEKGLSSEQKEALFSKISLEIEQNLAYTNPEITTTVLAELIGSNRAYVSLVINEKTGKNFNTYINEYRIKLALIKLSDPANHQLTLESIGHQVGFNSKSVFNRSFKNYTGLTPSYYLQSVKAEQYKNK